MLGRCQRGIELEEAGVSEQIGLEISGHFVELGGGREDEILVARFKVAVQKRSCPGLRNQHRSSAQKIDHRGHVKDVLVISREEEDAVGTDRTTDGPAELMLPALGFEVEEGRLGAERAVA